MLDFGIASLNARSPTEGKPNAQTASHVSSAFTASTTPALTTEFTAIYPAATSVAEGGSAQSHVFGSGAVQVTAGSMAAGSVLFLVLFGLIRWRNKRNNKEQHEWARMVPSRSTVSSQYDTINPNPFLLTEEIVGHNNIHENGGYVSSARPTQYLGSFMKSPYSS